jgi:nucleoside-diphosphate-sugar epimerase
MPIVYDSDRPVGPISRTADISQTRTGLGWEPQVSFYEGLSRTYRWVEKRLNEEAV